MYVNSTVDWNNSVPFLWLLSLQIKLGVGLHSKLLRDKRFLYRMILISQNLHKNTVHQKSKKSSLKLSPWAQGPEIKNTGLILGGLNHGISR